MIGDGMGLGHISAALVANKGKLNLQHMKQMGVMTTTAADEFITDSAAAATAIATGKKTRNGAVGVDASFQPQPNVRELFHHLGMKTGVLACCSITEATPAAFIAHQQERMLHEDIAADFLTADLDFFFGGGKDFFTDREDGLDLTLKLVAKGYELIEDPAHLPFVKEGKVAGLVDNCPSKLDGRGDYLSDVSMEAIRLLHGSEKGFFLVIEGSQIDWEAHGNETEGTVEELLDFDRTLGEVLEFAAEDKETLVIVTADHETGGMTVHDGSVEHGKVEGAFTTVMHTGIMVPVFAYGPKAELFQGMYDNTDLFQKMLDACHLTQATLAN